MKRAIVYGLAPLVWLSIVLVIACLLSYGLLIAFGDFWPLHKLVSKVTLLLLLLSIFPLKRLMDLSWAKLGFTPWKRMLRQYGTGLLVSLVSLLPVMLALYALDVQQWDVNRHWSPSKILEKAFLSLFFASLIGIGEEILFRGLLWGSLKNKIGWIYATAISAVYYAYLHFLTVKTQISYNDLTFASPWKLLAEAFANWLNPSIYSAWTSLLMVGLFLAVLRRHYTHGLALCIGCHAGWVWQIKIMKDLCNPNPNSDLSFLISQYDGVIGPLVSLWLAVSLIVWLSWLRATHTDRQHKAH